MFRNRKILRKAQNGGKECPELQQKRGCHGTKCEVRGVAKANRGLLKHLLFIHLLSTFDMTLESV